MWLSRHHHFYVPIYHIAFYNVNRHISFTVHRHPILVQRPAQIKMDRLQVNWVFIVYLLQLEYSLVFVIQIITVKFQFCLNLTH